MLWSSHILAAHNSAARLEKRGGGEDGNKLGSRESGEVREDNMKEWKENKEKGVGDATCRNRGDKRRDKVAVKGETVN